jgi:hypothetical protein
MDTEGSLLSNWKRAALLTERPVGGAAEMAAYRHRIYKQYKVEYMGDVDLRGEGGGGCNHPCGFKFHRIRLRSLQEVAIYEEQNGRWSKSGLPARPYDEWTRVWHRWRRRGQRWQP